MPKRKIKKPRKERNYLAVAAHFKKGGPHIDEKKEANRQACRTPVEVEDDPYEVCSCDESLYLKVLLEAVMYESPDLSTTLTGFIIAALNKEAKD